MTNEEAFPFLHDGKPRLGDVVFEMAPGHPIPKYETEGSAAFDLRAYLPEHGVVVPSGGRLLVPVGFRVKIPAGTEMQIRPRSGLALEYGITVLNSPGTIDSDYRGEVGVILYNSGTKPFGVAHGDRIAQGLIGPAPQYGLRAGDVPQDTQRGAGGFGSTGVK